MEFINHCFMFKAILKVFIFAIVEAQLPYQSLLFMIVLETPNTLSSCDLKPLRKASKNLKLLNQTRPF